MSVMVSKPVRLWAYRTFHTNNSQYLKYASTDGAGLFNYQEFDFSAYRFRRLAVSCYVNIAAASTVLDVNVYNGAVTGSPVLSVSIPGDATGLQMEEDVGESIREAAGAIALEFKSSGYVADAVQWLWLWAEVDLEPVI
jgi:hypothetical protein